MPCSDSLAHQKELEEIEKKQLQDRLDMVTRVLCRAFNEIERQNLSLNNFAIEEGLEWWEEHKAFDAARNNGPNKPENK